MISSKILFVFCCLSLGALVSASPQFDYLGGYDTFGICFTNCAQCKQLYGAHFDAERCAQTCITYRARNIPDCDDIASIAPFLVSLDLSK